MSNLLLTKALASTKEDGVCDSAAFEAFCAPKVSSKRTLAKLKLATVALEAIGQTVVQGKSYKTEAPDGTSYGRELSAIESMSAKILGWLGLSIPGLAKESYSDLPDEKKAELLAFRLNTQTRKLRAALENFDEKIEHLSDVDYDEEFLKILEENTEGL